MLDWFGCGSHGIQLNSGKRKVNLMQSSQYSAFATALQNDAGAAAFRTSGNDTGLASYCNALASPAFIVWRKSISRKEIYDAVVWSEMLVLTSAQRDTFALMMTDATLSPSSANIRTAFAAIFASANTTLANLTAAAKRQATVAEKMLATGTGTNGSPATLTFEGAVTTDDIQKSLRP